jgi:uncharacterized membrane protein
MRLLILPILLTAIGCSYETLHRQAPENNRKGGVICSPPDSTAPVVTYEQLAQTVFAPKCLSCHSSARPAGGLALDSYASAKARTSSILSLTANNLMPPSPSPALSPEEKGLIEAWVTAGAPEKVGENCDPSQNPEPPPTPPDTGELKEMPPDSEIDFELIQTRILELKCLTCHSTAAGNRGGLNLETYVNVRDEIDDILDEVEMNWMPPPPRPSLTDIEKRVLRIWFEKRMPQ